MLKLACAIYVYILELAVIVTAFKYRHYLRLITKRTTVYRQGKRCIRYQRIHQCVIPSYHSTYFAYDWFSLPGYANTVLIPTDNLRVYGIVRINSECLLLVKGDRVKTIVVYNDFTLIKEIEQSFYVVFRKILLIVLGGVTCWKILSILSMI